MGFLHPNQSFASTVAGICLGVALGIGTGPWTAAQEALTEGGRSLHYNTDYSEKDDSNCLQDTVLMKRI